jgi:hypothetical protein
MGPASSAFARGGARPASFAAVDRNRKGVIELDQTKRAAELLFEQRDRHTRGSSVMRNSVVVA